jgi:hypothetical protein
MNTPINSLAYKISSLRYQRTARTVSRGAISRLRDMETHTDEDEKPKQLGTYIFNVVIALAIIATITCAMHKAQATTTPGARAATAHGINLCKSGNYYESVATLAPLVASRKVAPEMMEEARAYLGVAYMHIGDMHNAKRFSAGINSKRRQTY